MDGVISSEQQPSFLEEVMIYHHMGLRYLKNLSQFSPEEIKDYLSKVPAKMVEQAHVGLSAQEQAVSSFNVQELDASLVALEAEERLLSQELAELEVKESEFIHHRVETWKENLRQNKLDQETEPQDFAVKVEIIELEKKTAELEQQKQFWEQIELPRLCNISTLDQAFDITYDKKLQIGFLANTPFGMDSHPNKKGSVHWDQTNACLSHICYLLCHLNKRHGKYLEPNRLALEIVDFPPQIRSRENKLSLAGPPNHNPVLDDALSEFLRIVDITANALIAKLQQFSGTEAKQQVDEADVSQRVQDTMKRLGLKQPLSLPFEIVGKSITRDRAEQKGLLGKMANMMSFGKDKKDEKHHQEITNYANVADWTCTLACLLVDLKYIILLNDILEGYQVPESRLEAIRSLQAGILGKEV